MLNRLSRFRTDFFGETRIIQKTYHLVKWDEVKRSMRIGRLGIRSITTMNKAFHGKCLWRFLSEEDNMWKKIIKIKWMNRGLDHTYLPSRPHGTSAWKNIMNMLEVLSGNVRWEVGREDKIKFWHDNWCGDVSLKIKFPNIFTITHNKDLLVADAFYSAGNCVVAVDRNLNDWELSEYVCFLQLMTGVNLLDKSDTLIWKLKKMAGSLLVLFTSTSTLLVT